MKQQKRTRTSPVIQGLPPLTLEERFAIVAEWLHTTDKVAVTRREHDVLLRLLDLVRAIDEAWGEP